MEWGRLELGVNSVGCGRWQVAGEGGDMWELYLAMLEWHLLR